MLHRSAVVVASLVLAACSASGSNAQPTTSSSAMADSDSATTTPPVKAPSEQPSAEPSGSQPNAVRIDDDVFGWADEHMTFSNESIAVRGSAPPPALIAALNRAGIRFMHVDETGVEHGPEVEISAPLGADGEELYTPNYVSAPTETPSGVHLYVDCKGVIDPRMRSRFLQILEEELSVLGTEVTVAVAE